MISAFIGWGLIVVILVQIVVIVIADSRARKYPPEKTPRRGIPLDGS